MFISPDVIVRAFLFLSNDKKRGFVFARMYFFVTCGKVIKKLTIGFRRTIVSKEKVVCPKAHDTNN